MTIVEIHAKAKAYTRRNGVQFLSGYEKAEYNAFIVGASMMREQYENNRLAHCDSMTEEEYNRESEFVTNFINERQRTPTFSDAIEITREQMIDKAAQWLREKFEGYESPKFLDTFIEEFRKAMEG